jgi:hypothetical protein
MAKRLYTRLYAVRNNSILQTHGTRPNGSNGGVKEADC